MNTSFQDTWQGIEAGWKNGRLAHAWLIHGPSHSAIRRFTDQFLNLVFDNHPQVGNRTHPDLVQIEPQSKSRQIVIKDIRRLIRQLSQTSYSGGWKTGVIFHADRMTDEAANALLKTLEEPPEKSLLLLITSEPQNLLPTIVSRCQRISISEEGDSGTSRQNCLTKLLEKLPPADAVEASILAEQVTEILNRLKKEFEEDEAGRISEDLSSKEAKTVLEARSTARLIEARSDILRMLLQWQRDVLLLVCEAPENLLCFSEHRPSLEQQAMFCSKADALRRIDAVEKMAQQFDRNLPSKAIFHAFFSEMAASKLPDKTTSSKRSRRP